MRRLRLQDLPIRRKLLLITLATTASALLVAGGTIVAFDYALFRQSLERDLSVLTQITADNSTAELAFNDPGAAEQTLGALKSRTHVISACIFRPNGSVLAEYRRPGTGRGCPEHPARGAGVRFGAGQILAWREVTLGPRFLGMLALNYDLGEVSDRLRIFGGTVITVLLIATIFSILLSALLRGTIADPVSELVDATTKVARTGDYSTRAVKVSGDELGLLVDRFNQMLGTIESREATLRQALSEREEALRAEEKARERFHFMAESMP